MSIPNPDSPKAKFTGIWIPVEIWNYPDRKEEDSVSETGEPKKAISGLRLMEKILYGCLHSLGGMSEYGCYASNRFLSERLQISEGGINNMLMSLKREKLIRKTVRSGTSGRLRQIWIEQAPLPTPREFTSDGQFTSNGVKSLHQTVQTGSSNDVNCPPPLYVRDKSREKSEERRDRTAKAYAIPAGEEAKEYARTIGMSESESDSCFDHFQSNGWLVGKNKMKDWKAAWRNWHRRSDRFSTLRNGQLPASNHIDPFAGNHLPCIRNGSREI
jgi:hypothetical protein